MKKKIIFACLLSFSLNACRDSFLTIVPETQLSSATFFKTQADFAQAVNAAYVPLRTILNDRIWRVTELHSDNAYYARNILFGAVDATENIADFAVPTANGITANDNVLQIYRQEFLIIARANQVLALIDGVEFDAEVKKNLKGQALFLRANAYFDLVRLFGKVPMHLTPVANRQEAASKLATADVIYAQIDKDATEAATLLPNKAKQEAGRVTSGTAKTLLANLYLVQKKWAQAEAAAKDVVTNGGYSLMPGYDQAFTTSTSNKNNAESVFEIQYMEGAAGYNGSFIYQVIPAPITAEELAPITGTSNPQSISGENNNIPTPDIIAAYEAGDTRKDVSIGFVTLSQSHRTASKVYPYIKKFAKPHALQGNTGNNLPVYRYSEVLLFLAEALNEQNKTTDAATYLNMVRKRAGLTDSKAASTADMREAIFKERRVELAFENKRWFDIVRTGRVKELIGAYGARIKANPANYYFSPPLSNLPANAFTVLDDYYGLPAVESALTPEF